MARGCIVRVPAFGRARTDRFPAHGGGGEPAAVQLPPRGAGGVYCDFRGGSGTRRARDAPDPIGRQQGAPTRSDGLGIGARPALGLRPTSPCPPVGRAGEGAGHDDPDPAHYGAGSREEASIPAENEEHPHAPRGFGRPSRDPEEAERAARTIVDAGPAPTEDGAGRPPGVSGFRARIPRSPRMRASSVSVMTHPTTVGARSRAS